MLVLFAGLHRKTDQHLLLEAGVSLNLTLIKGVKASTQVENSYCHANGGGRPVFVALVFLFSVTHSAWLVFSFQYPLHHLSPHKAIQTHSGMKNRPLKTGFTTCVWVLLNNHTHNHVCFVMEDF